MKTLYYRVAPVVLLSLATLSYAHSVLQLKRSNFPQGFIFGAASSAYQVTLSLSPFLLFCFYSLSSYSLSILKYEGAANADGRKPSIWDTYVVQHPEKIADGSTGDVAEEFYYRYKEDISRVKEIGLDSFRFSISWPRILPQGKVSGGINQKGIAFYNLLIDDLLSNGIEPMVTLFHWDVPQALEDEYGGFLSPNIVNDFVEYANICFKEFGDRVKYWLTVNEPNLFSSEGYAEGVYAPGRCSFFIGNCTQGDSATEPYIVAHHLILSHAAAVQLYRAKYQASQNGSTGLTVSCQWAVPKFDTEASRKAASRAIDFECGWILNPLTYGSYPESMRVLVGNRLPNFTEAESNMAKGSFNFLGINYYTAHFANDSVLNNNVNLSYTTDSHVNLTDTRNGTFIGEPTGASWLHIYPQGLYDLLLYLKRNYQNPSIIITENGMSYANNDSQPISYFLNDSLRIKYHRLHLEYLLEAINMGVDVKGYYIWSFLDDFEWSDGYTQRYGMVYVNLRDGLTRYLKDSAFWFHSFLQNGIDNSSLLYTN